jgi:hypothetical protein
MKGTLMLRRIRQILWTLFLLAMAPEAFKLVWLVIHSPEARSATVVFACIFVTLWFYGHIPRRYDAGGELHERRLRTGFYNYR